MKKLFLLSIITLIICLTSCTPADVNPADETNTINPASVYLTGFFGKDACYWKDGVITILRNSPSYTSSFARSVFVSGKDVYVLGEIRTNSSKYAVYWKNGVEHILSNLQSQVYSISVFGNDVYLVGQIMDSSGSFIPHYWKNGVPFSFNATATDRGVDIKVVNGDVYICGNTSNFTGTSLTTPVYWKNGVITILPTTQGAYGAAEKMIFNGNDMYIYGEFGGRDVYWKNDNIEYVFEFGIVTTGMAISGNDVYVSGSRYDSALNSTKAKYWKNGIEHNISNNANETMAAGIAVKSNNVFIAEYMTGAGCSPNGNMNTIINGVTVNVVENVRPTSIFVVN